MVTPPFSPVVAHILDKLTKVKDGAGSGKWTAQCPVPAHQDHNNSLSIAEGERGSALLKCFAGCDISAIVQALGMELHDLFADEGGKGGIPPRPAQQLQQSQQDNAAGGCTLTAYAEAKCLPLGFLKMQGVSEIPFYEGAPAVRILYRDEAGMEDGVQFRLALAKSPEGDMRFKWRKGSKATLYGRWRLPEERRRKAASMVLVEGPSDCHTLWYHGIPALGIPGASTWKEDRDASYFDGFDTIYVVIEPDAGGEGVKTWLAKSALRDRVRLVQLGNPHKDPSELHIACAGDREQFKAKWEAALAAATPWSEQEADTAWAACATLAQQPDLLSAFAAALAARGVAGEVRAAKLLYLALTSRVFDRPASVIVKAPSSTGKSFVAEKVAEFFPPEAYLLLSAMSERALVYGDDDLQHRFLIIAEAEGLQGGMGSYIVRTLLSEGRLVYGTVEKTAEGLRGRTIAKEGPTGLIVGTTAVSLHQENETRHISLPVTDTPEQTKAVFRVLAREARKGKGTRADAEQQLVAWHALQRWLASTGDPEVDIPYADALAELIPPLAVRLRRDFKTLLILIKSHAFLHQQQRTQDGDGRIVATVEDYDAVRALVADLVAEGVEASVSVTIRQTVTAVDELMTSEDHLKETGVSVTALAAQLKLDKSVVSRRVKVAVARGYLRNLEQRDRQPARLILGVAMPADVSVLPSAEQVRTYTPEPVATVATVAGEGETIPPSPPNGSNGYHPEWHPWQPRLEELMAGGMAEREALAQAMAEQEGR